MTRIVVLDDWQGVAERSADWSAIAATCDIVFLREKLVGADALVAALDGADAVVAMRERTVFPAVVVERLSSLKLLVFTGWRNAAVDVEACTRCGILVCNTGAGMGNSAGTAELALGLMLAAARGIPLADAEMRAGRFQERTSPGLELRGRTLGLVGVGRIGAQMAAFGRVLGMEVLAWSQNLTDARAAEASAVRVDKAALFARSDVVSVHMVLSERSRGIVGAAEIAAMKPGAILVNTSRAPLVDNVALLAAVQARRVVAALDVFDTEPLPPGDPWRGAANTVLTPHLGYVTQENMAELYRQCAEDVAAWLAGAPIRVVNPEVYGSM